MKKKYYAVIVLILSMLFINVNAETIDPTRTGSISGINTYGSKALANNALYIYKVANVSAEGELTYVEAFQDAGYELNNLTASQLNTLAINLEKYIDTKKLTETATTVTDEEGRFNFTNLGTGLYLIKNQAYVDGSYEYRVLSLTSIPNFNEMDKIYMYDIISLPKIDAKLIKTPDDDNNGNNTNNGANNTGNDKEQKIPNTYDNVYLYIGLLLVAVVGIGIIIYCSSKSKRSDKNEKKSKNNNNN